MEWRNNPPKDPLERSGSESGERNRYSREAGDNSSNSSYDSYSRKRRDGVASANGDSITVRPRRRRRISEMEHVSPTRYSSANQDNNSRYDRDSYNDYRTERAESNSQRNYYKEQYNQVREAKRKRFDGRSEQGSRDNERNGGYPQRRNNDYTSHSRRKNFNPNRSNSTKPRNNYEKRPPVYELPPIDLEEEVRLNKFLSNSGVCSRREADELIKVGAVVVNGIPVTELGTKITAKDRVEVNGREVKPENKVYVLLNKPRNCVTTTDDPQERLTVTNLVRSACKERIYPVGRLDRNTTGVLLLTNDGDLAAKLVHPTFMKKKIYHVWLDKEVEAEDMQKIADGVELEDGEMHADAISYVTEDDLTQVGIEIHSGKNRIVRRLFEHLGYHVKKLDRVYFAGLTKKNLGRGKWRYLTQEEVNALQRGSFE